MSHHSSQDDDNSESGSQDQDQNKQPINYGKELQQLIKLFPNNPFATQNFLPTEQLSSLITNTLQSNRKLQQQVQTAQQEQQVKINDLNLKLKMTEGVISHMKEYNIDILEKNSQLNQYLQQQVKEFQSLNNKLANKQPVNSAQAKASEKEKEQEQDPQQYELPGPLDNEQIAKLQQQLQQGISEIQQTLSKIQQQQQDDCQKSKSEMDSSIKQSRSDLEEQIKNLQVSKDKIEKNLDFQIQMRDEQEKKMEKLNNQNDSLTIQLRDKQECQLIDDKIRYKRYTFLIICLGITFVLSLVNCGSKMRALNLVAGVIILIVGLQMFK